MKVISESLGNAAASQSELDRRRWNVGHLPLMLPFYVQLTESNTEAAVDLGHTTIARPSLALR